MQKQSISSLIRAWLKKRASYIGLILLLMVNYIMVAALKHIDLSAVLYSTLLGGFIGSIIAILDFRKYIKKYYALLNTYYNKSYNLEFLPASTELIEKSYIEIIEALYEDLSLVKRNIERQQQEANDYYTLWTHQIKTPIAAIRVLIQNQDNKPMYKRKEALLLEGELFKIEQYAHMALQYLRLETMSQDLSLKSYRLYDIVANALKKYGVIFIGKELAINVENFDVEVITDEKWLQFVIEQIISNSIKYTYTGNISIKMKDDHTLCISDTGIGIRSEDLPRIFERGFTGYNGRMDKKSTGIGLYLCKRVINKLSHSLEVKSNIGEGTSVYIGFEMQETYEKD